MQIYPGWNEFQNQELEKKLPLFEKDGAIFDVLYAQQFSRKQLEKLFTIADSVRTIAKTKNGHDYLRTLLSDKRAMLFFVQPSTRTFLSFQNACHILGMQTSEIRDSSTSSEAKGESPEDMIRTFSSYVDLVIIRHFNEGFAERAAWTLNTHTNRPIPVINGGSGKDQHPTQALLDMYTLERSFKDKSGIDGKKITLVGDLKRGRTVRSLCRLLALYQDITIQFVAPEPFRMRSDIIEFLKQKNVAYVETNNFEDAIKNTDAIYQTRLQDEHDKGGESSEIDYSLYALEERHLELIQEHTVILHPFPRRNEISVDVDKDPRAAYWKQARNGMWVRIALILSLFQRDNLLY
jgi:aspartate carbamoyltransferase catalytic subunit